jgi:hypothetical protein
VHLPCALFWPSFGADEPYERDEEDWDWPRLWVRRPGARRAEFHAERDRLAALIVARLGAPEFVVTGTSDRYRAVWRMADRALLLETGDDIRSYSEYDVLGIRLRRYDASLNELDG